jgi:hypothetical protein
MRSDRRRGRGAARLGRAADRIGGGLLVNVVLFGALSAVGYWYSTSCCGCSRWRRGTS